MEWEGQIIQSQVDYILTDSPSLQVKQHHVRTVPFVDTNHCMVYVDVNPGDQTAHKQYCYQLKQFPLPRPTGTLATEADRQFEDLVAAQEEGGQKTTGQKPHWISGNMWQLLQRKAALRALQPMPA